MKVSVHYFGMLAEVTSVAKETLILEGDRVSNLLHEITTKYPALKEKQFQVAVDHSIATHEARLTENSEIALLPPFAGG